MRFLEPTSIKEIADFLGCEIKGDADLMLNGLNEIHTIYKNHIVLVDQSRHFKKASESDASVILAEHSKDFDTNKTLLISEQPFDDFNKLIVKYTDERPWKNARPPKIGDSEIADNVIFGDNVIVGDNCVIHPGVILGANTIIKDNVIIQANSVIGSDAFYYKRNDQGLTKLISCGGTILKDHVEVGAMSTIDRGVTDNTIIGKGTKIDNQVHIGHDAHIGANCLFAAQVGIAGCVVIEDNVILWGQVGVAADVKIENNVTVHAQSGVSNNLPANGTYFGSPATEVRKAWKEIAAVKKLPSIIETI